MSRKITVVRYGSFRVFSSHSTRARNSSSYTFCSGDLALSTSVSLIPRPGCSFPFPLAGSIDISCTLCRNHQRRWLDASCTRSEEHTSELQSLRHLVCRLL